MQRPSGPQDNDQQSSSTAQETPNSHLFGQLPPQSTSLSSPSFLPSLQLAAAHLLSTPQASEAQSPSTPHA
jgi:hypothetical protein